MAEADVRIRKDRLEQFCCRVFESLGLSAGDAQMAAAVLVAADVRGIPSHGVGRLWRYVNGLRENQMLSDVAPEFIVDTPTSVIVDAQGGMGAPASIKTMQSVIDKAGESGCAFGCVKNSNHFGIAGFYAMMALEHDMLGIAMTNPAAHGVPTFARQVMFGTNPLAFAAPADRERAFVLDMSTTVVSRGKVEVYDRKEEPLPLGWAVDKTGHAATDARSILDDMFRRVGGGILPLGGEGEQYGGYKGYGLAVMVDILCAVLAGSPFGDMISDTATTSARVSHFFGAIKIDHFRDPADFRADMDKMLASLRNCPPAEGENRVYFAGQKEFEKEQEALDEGILVLRKSYDQLCKIGSEQGVEL